ncbi:16S rRNA (cytosine(1402)-N(4))-methyltransferase RsmH [bacterium]|nr:16S rRNA (cytosine(1402)-N(4))-methyltransferase RsmH [bacterium]MCK4325949.1 16S rRNA (cytosine(1402)-N(4))-methyltransferase RsmH [bacterium]MCK4436581.1 16S rRNA (cytosine(1402)-N(4))-methyltransferase RsmH [bacterium]
MEHIPVLVKEALRFLNCRPGGIYVDCTVGEGGHAKAMLERLGGQGKLIGIDQDGEAIKRTAERLKKYRNLTLIQDNFRNLSPLLKKLALHAPRVDGLLFDLGVSSLQLDSPERGFSFRFEPLDMRMDTRISSTATAAHLVNRLSREELIKILKEFGEERWARRISKLIVERRKEEPIRTAGQLVEIIKEAIPRLGGRIHPATRTFQALRIAVNQELEALKEGLEGGIKVLSSGGRICIISYHSLEDRLVKEQLKRWANPCQCPPRWPVCRCQGKPVLRILTKGPVRPGQEEILRNPRSRSAKLRAGEKI